MRSTAAACQRGHHTVDSRQVVSLTEPGMAEWVLYELAGRLCGSFWPADEESFKATAVLVPG